MKTVKTRGVVIKEYEAGESDKRLVLLCKGHGRVTVYARGARKPKSKFLAAAQLFAYSDFVLAQGQGFFSVAQADIIERFYDLCADYERLRHAHMLAEICERTVLENSNCDALLFLLLKSLSKLSNKKNIPPKQVLAVFLFRFYLFYGLTPQVRVCAACGTETEGSNYFYEEGLACEACAKKIKARIFINPGTVAALRYILENEVDKAFLFKAEEEILKQLTQAGKLYWDRHFEWGLKADALLPVNDIAIK